MSGKKREKLPAALMRAQQRFVAWRRNGRPGKHIPKPLWALAVKLAKRYGVSRTAVALGLNHTTLKERVAEEDSQPSTREPTFVELPAPPAISVAEFVIEFEDGSGATMRVHLKGCDPPDLVALGRGFWNGE